MSSHFLQWLLLSLGNLLATLAAHPHSLPGLNEPIIRCSVADTATWLTLQDLGNLVAQWAIKEGVSPIRVLHGLENSLLTSAQVHSQPSSLEGSDDSDEEQRRSYLRMPMHNPPIMNGPPLPPIDVPPPPVAPHYDSFLGLAPPPLPFEPPSSPLRPPFMGHFPRFQPLLPPPNVTVQISNGGFGVQVPAMDITVPPNTSIIEVLGAAAKQFETDMRTSPSDVNFYKVKWGKKLKCVYLQSVGNLSATRNYVWEVTVKGLLGQKIFDGVCLKPVEILPGMTITLNYIEYPGLLDAI